MKSEKRKKLNVTRCFRQMARVLMKDSQVLISDSCESYEKNCESLVWTLSNSTRDSMASQLGPLTNSWVFVSSQWATKVFQLCIESPYLQEPIKNLNYKNTNKSCQNNSKLDKLSSALNNIFVNYLKSKILYFLKLWPLKAKKLHLTCSTLFTVQTTKPKKINHLSHLSNEYKNSKIWHHTPELCCERKTNILDYMQAIDYQILNVSSIPFNLPNFFIKCLMGVGPDLFPIPNRLIKLWNDI